MGGPMSLGRGGARAALALLGPLALSAMLATSAGATTIGLPAGAVAFVRNVNFGACDGLTFGYQLDAGAKTELASHSAGCGESTGRDAEIGPFTQAHKVRFYLTDNTCGFTFFSDGTEHTNVIGA